MQKEEAREVLIRAAKELLAESEDPGKITSRRLAAKAGMNPAMINYCFQSKDELMATAIWQLITDSAGTPLYLSNTEAPPMERLWNMLWELSELVVKFRRFTRVSIPFILLQGEIGAPLYILPILREQFPQKSETECRVIAYQLISFIQLVFYRSETFKKYAGIDLADRAGRKAFLEMQFRLFFKEGTGHE